jgi:hypothetical protein
VAASEDRDQQRSQMNATRTAEEPTNVSVGGQTSLEQYEDGQAPEQAAHAGQDYSEPGADGQSDARGMLSEKFTDDEIANLRSTLNDMEDSGNNYLKAAASDAVKGAIGGAVAGSVAGPVGTVGAAAAGFAGGAAKGLAGEASGSIAVNWSDNDTNIRQAFSQEIKDSKAGAIYSTAADVFTGGEQPNNAGGAMSGGSGDSGGNKDAKDYE